MNSQFAVLDDGTIADIFAIILSSAYLISSWRPDELDLKISPKNDCVRQSKSKETKIAREKMMQLFSCRNDVALLCCSWSQLGPES